LGPVINRDRPGRYSTIQLCWIKDAPDLPGHRGPRSDGRLAIFDNQEPENEGWPVAAFSNRREGVHAPATADPLWQESLVLAGGPRGRPGRPAQHGRETKRQARSHRDGSGIFAADGSLCRANEAGPDIVRSTRTKAFGPGIAHCSRRPVTALRVRPAGLRPMDLAVTDRRGARSSTRQEREPPRPGRYNAATGSGEPSPEYFSYHVEREVRRAGNGQFDGHPHEIEGSAWRDHSWGVRHWDGSAVRFFAGGTARRPKPKFPQRHPRAGTMSSIGQYCARDGRALDGGRGQQR